MARGEKQKIILQRVTQKKNMVRNIFAAWKQLGSSKASLISHAMQRKVVLPARLMKDTIRFIVRADLSGATQRGKPVSDMLLVDRNAAIAGAQPGW